MSNSTHKRKINDITSTNDDKNNKLIVKIDDPLRPAFHLTLSIDGQNVRVLSSRITGNIDDDVLIWRPSQCKKNCGLSLTINGEESEPLWKNSMDAIHACKMCDLEGFKSVVEDQFKWNSAIHARSFLEQVIPAIMDNIMYSKQNLFFDAIKPLFRAVQHHTSRMSEFSRNYVQEALVSKHFYKKMIHLAADGLNFGLYRLLNPFLLPPYPSSRLGYWYGDYNENFFCRLQELTGAFIEKIRSLKDGKFGEVSRSFLQKQGYNISMIKEVVALSPYFKCCPLDVRHVVFQFIFGVNMPNIMFIHS